MSDLLLCGPCGYADNNINAEKWCTVCEEGLCADCEKVHKSIKYHVTTGLYQQKTSSRLNIFLSVLPVKSKTRDLNCTVKLIMLQFV